MKFLIKFLIILLFIYPIQALANDFYDDTDNPISFIIEVLPWTIVNQILPKGTIFTVIDVETGLKFKVQRRAGNKHADVQPITKKDTMIMKKVYSGQWSWDRRAIIALVDDQMIAASMHGMPHGAGALKNGFPGHFCIHFWGSKTHKTKHMDQAHKLMILKAGGKIDSYLNQVDPYELINIFKTVVNNHDKKLLNLIIHKTKNQSQVITNMRNITYLDITNKSLLPLEDINALISIEIPIKVEYYKNNRGRKIKKELNMIISRDSPMDRWYIDGQHFLEELDKKG